MGSYRDWLALDRAMNAPAPSRSLVSAENPDHSIRPERWKRQGIDNPNIRGRSGYVGDALYGWVTDAEVDAFNDALKRLQADASYYQSAGGSKYPDALSAIVSNLSALVAEWDVWVQNNSWLTDRLIADDDMASFRRRYQDLRGYLLRVGGKTSAPDSPSAGFKLPWWALPAVGVALAVVFVGPALAPVVASMLAKKAVMKAAVLA